MRNHDSIQPHVLRILKKKNTPMCISGLSLWVTTLFQEEYSPHLGCDVISFLFGSLLKKMQSFKAHDPGKCEVTPQCSINHSDFQNSKVRSKASAVLEEHQHFLMWIRKKKVSLPLGFNHGAGLTLPRCDILITMISTRGARAFVVFRLHGSTVQNVTD